MKSRIRVKSYGEVFTPRHMVDKMLDLVANELEGPGFVDKTFLEPSAGDGNFLVAILQRKLAAVERTYEPAQWSQESLFALATSCAATPSPASMQRAWRSTSRGGTESRTLLDPLSANPSVSPLCARSRCSTSTCMPPTPCARSARFTKK